MGRAEIEALQFGEIKRTRIPAAGRELDEVVKATEAASNTIMECAEAVLSADAADPATFKAMVEEKMLIVFEACAFQDIAGQRISKVLDTLAHIEARVARLADAMRGPEAGGYLNAHTIYDNTAYYTVLPSSSFAKGLEIQADAYANSVIDGRELAKEMEVIIQEAKRKSDSPSAVATETLFALLHDAHRMRRWRPIISTAPRSLRASGSPSLHWTSSA